MSRFRTVSAFVLISLWLVLPANAEILIATAGPFTGKNIFRGEQIQHGAEMAVEDINAAGGVLGERVRLLIADDACDPEQAKAVAKKLVKDGVLFVAGHVCSHASIPAAGIYEQAGIIMISPASTNPKLTDSGRDNVFRVCGRDDEQGIVAGNYLAEHFGSKRIAILNDGSTYGKGLAQETLQQLKKLGVKTVVFESFDPDNRDYSKLVVKLQQLGIDVIYIGGYSADVGLIVRLARDRKFNAQVISGDALTNYEFWMITVQPEMVRWEPLVLIRVRIQPPYLS